MAATDELLISIEVPSLCEFEGVILSTVTVGAMFCLLNGYDPAAKYIPKPQTLNPKS